jgi:PKD repeat protein
VLNAPIAFQEGPGGRVPVAASFVPRGDGWGYDLGGYDPGAIRVIDPVLKYSSYLGASGSEWAWRIQVVEPAGLPAKRTVYVAGFATGSAFPAGFASTTTTGATGGYQGFLARMTYDRGTHAMTGDWFTYIGGGSTEYLYDFDLDAAGDLVVAGETYSIDFPRLNPIKHPTTGPAVWDGNVRSGPQDGFVSKLSPSGTLLFSSYIGSATYDYIQGVAGGPSGRVAVAGYTYCATFCTTAPWPMVNNAQSNRNGFTDAVVAVIDTTTAPASIVYSTYLGGNSDDYAFDIAMDSFGTYVTGYTYTASTSGTPFPTTAGAFQTVSRYTPSAFVTAYSPTGAYRYSTLLDGDEADYGWRVVPDGTGGVWVAGDTYWWGWYTYRFPTCPTSCPAGSPPPLMSGPAGSSDAFVVRISSDGARMLYGTYFGGTSDEYLKDLKIAPGGDILISGWTYSSTGLPIASAPYPSIAGGADMFVTRFNPTTSALVLSTYLGSTGWDYGYGVSADSKQNVFVTGYTDSTAFPILDALQPTKAAGTDGFVTVFGKDPPKPVIRASAVGYAASTVSPYKVLTAETITVDGSLSTPGLFAIDPTKTTWVLKNPDLSINATIVGTLTPTASPSWPTLKQADNVKMNVCLTLYDTDPEPYDNSATTCMDLEWLNRAPKALIISATPNPVRVGDPVTFVGSGTDPDGYIVSYDWSYPGGTASGATASYAFPTDGVKLIKLEVTDDDGAKHSVTTNVTVFDGPIALHSHPAATYLPGDLVVFTDLSVAGKKPIKKWRWDFGDGSAPVEFLSSPPATLSHSYARYGWYSVSLYVDDGSSNNTYTEKIWITPDTPTPMDDAYATMEAMPITVAAPGLLANDFHPQGYAMTIANVSTPLAGNITVKPDGSFTYTPPKGFIGTDIVTYDVTDGIVGSLPAVVTFTVSPYPPPVASIGTSMRGSTGIFTDLSVRGYHSLASWSWSFGDGATSTDKDPVHLYAASGAYPVTLTVVDTWGLASSDTAWVFVAPDRTHPVAGSDPPRADAGSDRAVGAGETVVLSGTGIQPGASALYYRWVQVSGPPVVLAGAYSASASFVAPDVAGSVELVFALVVHDSHRPSSPDTVKLLVQGHKASPVAATAVKLQSGRVGSAVLLDGSPSFDPSGGALTYHWQQVSGPRVAPAEPNAAKTAIVVPEGTGSLVYRLTVASGGMEASALTEVRIVPGDGPVAMFDVEPTAIPGSYQFIDRSTDGVTRYWDFGDATATSHAAEPVHQFTRSGTVPVTLSVVDGQGRVDTITRMVDVRLDAAVREAAPPMALASPDTAELEAARADAQAHASPAIALGFLVAALVLAAVVGIARRR